MPVFSGKLNVVLVMQRSRVTHIRQGLLMFSFPMPEWPMMPFQTVWSEITLALKLPSQIILFLSGSGHAAHKGCLYIIGDSDSLVRRLVLTWFCKTQLHESFTWFQTFPKGCSHSFKEFLLARWVWLRATVNILFLVLQSAKSFTKKVYPDWRGPNNSSDIDWCNLNGSYDDNGTTSEGMQ